MGVHVPRTRPPYPPEFRAEAVRLLRSTGRTPQQIADDLGVSRQSVATWARQADLDDGRRDDGQTTAEREELRRLRREVRELRSRPLAFSLVPRCQGLRGSQQYTATLAPLPSVTTPSDEPDITRERRGPWSPRDLPPRPPPWRNAERWAPQESRSRHHCRSAHLP